MNADEVDDDYYDWRPRRDPIQLVQLANQMNPHRWLIIGPLSFPAYEDDGMWGVYMGANPETQDNRPDTLPIGKDVMEVPWMMDEGAVLRLLQDFPVFAHLKPMLTRRRTMLEVAVTYNLSRVCSAIIKINPKCIHSRDSTHGRPLHRAAISLSVQCCRLLIEAGARCPDPSIIDGCVRVSRFRDVPGAYMECLWTLIDYGKCPVSAKTIQGSEPVRCVMWARVRARDAALVMVGMSRLKSPVVGQYNGRDVTRLVGLAVWMTRYLWLDVEVERCKKHRKEHPNLAYEA